MPDADRILRRIADRQVGLLTLDDVRNKRISERVVYRRARSGVLQRIYPGVYHFGAGTLTAQQLALAACLACGDGSFASGRTSGALWNIVDVPAAPEVTVPEGSSARTHGIRIRRSRSIGRGEQTMLGPVPVATVARTLYDLARDLNATDLERACDKAFRQRLISPQRLANYLKKKKHGKLLRQICRDRIEHGVHDTDFEMEAERVLLEHGLPRPERQYPYVANGRRVRFDLYYPAERVAIEPNGRGPHSTKEQWQADHDKRVAAKAAGINMLEFTWDDVHHRQLYFVTTVADALDLKPVRWAKRTTTGPDARSARLVERSQPDNASKRSTTRKGTRREDVVVRRGPTGKD